MASAIAGEVKQEVDKDIEEFGLFHSLYEGLSTLRDEYKKLEDAILWDAPKTGDTTCVRDKAIQVAAMATKIAMQTSPVPIDLPHE